RCIPSAFPRLEATPRGASRIKGMPGLQGIVSTGLLWPQNPGAKDSPVRKAIPILTPLALLVGFGCMGLGAAMAADPPLRLPRDQLLVYRGPDGNPVAVKTPGDWAKRRAEIVRGMESVMGKLPGDEKRCPPDPKTEEEFDCGTYVRRLVTYVSEPD